MQRRTVEQALALYRAGCYAEAEAEARAVASVRAWPREQAPLALSIAAMAAYGQGRHAEALATYDELLPVFGRIFGAAHPQTLALRSNRARTLSALSRHAECEAECAAVTRAVARRGGSVMRDIAAASDVSRRDHPNRAAQCPRAVR
ncbi:tetratricopeptide repeat protein [Streptomyces caeni]|uniref:Tetratricopeptide repeat protein n=1 Tax=Streptomyces caeni TaxID=2307231 RepID=A0ABW4IJJ5_9ACTN